MYVEYKGNELAGEGRIGLVELSKSKRSYKYDGKELLKVRDGYKYNCIDTETSERYWVSGPRRDGQDRLYGGIVYIDPDVREEYWTTIRNKPEDKSKSSFRCFAK
jgi:hypothetical protein